MKKKVNIKKTVSRLWREHSKGRSLNEERAIAWEVVYEFCLELGMEHSDESAIQRVLRFIYERGEK